ncbi:MAG: hypothetical protein K8R36_07300 [Planctomycetales bacterium]|nr:hypothetical protein [Planctomycetales bacterium]
MNAFVLPDIGKKQGRLCWLTTEIESREVRANTELDFAVTFQGSADEAPRMLLVEVLGKGTGIRRSTKLTRRSRASDKVVFKAVQPIEVLEPDEFVINIRDFGPPISKDPLLTSKFSARISNE